MSLLLERDNEAELQSHLDELTGRVTLLFAVIIGLTLLCVTQIDGWLDQLLMLIDPCSNACLNLYDPARWSAVRWLSSILVAIAISSPLILQQAWAFSHKGLLPNERKWVFRWMVGGTILSFVIAAWTLGWFLPFTFGSGHTLQSDMGLVARYDAVLMLEIALAVIWTQTVVCLAVLGMAIAGQIGTLNQHTADWWRMRCYALVVLLLYASLPEFGGLAFMLITLSILVIEFVCKPWLIQSARQMPASVTIMDEEGGPRRPVVFECTCDGAALPLPAPLNLTVPHLKYTGLCSSVSEREHLYETIQSAKISDVFITGCDAKPLGEHFHKNCQSLGARVRGMNLIERQSYRTQPASNASLEFQLMTAQLVSPWPQSGQLDRVFSLLKQNPETKYVYSMKSAAKSWGQQLKPEDVLVHIEKEHQHKLVMFAKVNGIQMRPI
ncbi:MAG: twin-arginine translocase subunit TatC [Candidatus Poseidoniaceae archaeon]|nr:twin-arginine translocase subunit TatC [Candidatus Poseidoniaceae archaeon]